MSNWIECPLEQLGEISSGGTPSRANSSFWNGVVPWVTPSDITSTKSNYIFDTKDSVTESGVRASSAKLLPEGTLLLTSRATIGEIKIAARPVTTNQGFKNIVPKSQVDGTFLFYQLSRMKGSFERFAAGSTFLEINRKDTGRVIILLPENKEVQFQIAKILQTIDEAIEKTEALIEKYHQIKAGLMHDLFTRGIGPDGKLRPPREEAPELYQETPIGWIPVDWRIENLGSLIGAIESGWSPTCEGDPAPQGEWGVLKTTAVVWNGYEPDENKKLPAMLNGKPSIETKPGDLLITRKGPVERVGVAVHVPNTPSLLMFPDTVFRTRLINDSEISVEFLALAIQSNQVQRYWDQRKVGLAEAQVNLNHGILRRTPIVKPPLKEQTQFLERYDAVHSRLSSLGQELTKMQKLKEGLMHDLLTGDVSVNVEAEAKSEGAHV